MNKSLSTNALNSLDYIISTWNDFHKTIISSSTFLSDNLQSNTNEAVNIQGLKGSLPAFFIKEFVKRKSDESLSYSYTHSGEGEKNDFVLVFPSQKDMEECESDLNTLYDEKCEIIKLNWFQTLPYRPCGLGSQVFGERVGFLSKILTKNKNPAVPRFFLIPQRALLTPLPPPEYIKKHSFQIIKKQALQTEELSTRLASLGFLRVPKVCVPGEYAVRGEVVDIFLAGEKNPVRIIFDFDTVEQIKTFDKETQTSISSLQFIQIYPMKEVLWDEELCNKLETVLEKEDSEGVTQNFNEIKAKEIESGESQTLSINNANVSADVHLSFTDEAKNKLKEFLEKLRTQREVEGEELFYGSIWDKTYTIKDYLTQRHFVFFFDYDKLVNAQKLLENEYAVSYRTVRQYFPVLRPSMVLLNFNSLTEALCNRIYFRVLETEGDSKLNDENGYFYIQSQASTSFFGNITYFKEQLEQFQNDGYRIYIYADNENQALRINELIKDYTEPQDKKLIPVTLISVAISEGFLISSQKILVIQENEIFGRKKNNPKSTRNVKSKAIDTFVDLNPGDYIVHISYGIGLFKGIERVKSMGMERDYIKLEYAQEETVFVPIEQVNMVQRYIGNENSSPRLDTIGSKSWSSRKAKVQQKVEEIAEKLIDLYSKRKASHGYPFPKDSEWNTAFEAAFPYEDTPDQLTATEEIKTDMEKNVPMDRLVCGDVGYGKTELAMRAAFKAVMGGKQVAFLAPTTILAEQHYENCLERFKNFPVSIARLSRFVPNSQQKKIIEKLEKGEVDIIIGTHRIIQKDVIFKDLGLLIIDEEQRFGVKDKEKLKSLKYNIDCLALSATPIPRTLHMSLLKIRDMSLLTTPPQNRQPIETVIDSYSDEKIVTAVRNEIERGGQVFFLHNRVETLNETKLKLENLMPELLIETAHGKMSSEELDEIFHRFKMGGFHILVATTIIENGIDIPNVNTIIIDRADMYGVSQLYQLKGRVGRSDRKAYAYLLYPQNKALSEVAMKRLQVISDFTELGSGFKIAMKDMEIRGAGNLLGKDQSGEVYAVGFEMYINLLNAAIERLTNAGWKPEEEVLLELEYTGFIPNSYINDAETKMEMYKKIAVVTEKDQLDSVWAELNDRFGPVPDEVESLLSLAKIKILCKKLSIRSLREKRGLVRVEFGEVYKINIDKVLNLIKLNNRIKLDPVNPNQLLMQTQSINLTEKSEFILQKLEQLI